MYRQRFLLLFLLFVFPTSSNYALDSFSFGSGGTASSASSLYSLEGVSGELGGSELTGTSYNAWPGLLYTQMADTPAAPTFTNVSNDYDKLLIQLDTGGNASDAEFAIAISDDNWVTTEYVQSDNTVGAVLGDEDWQSYTAWGSGTGEYIIGLNTNTTYKVKVKARQGWFTEGPWGPEASAATAALTLSFDIDVSSTDTETSAPYTVDLGNLTPGSVTTATDKIWIDLTTNANTGGYVYVLGENQGLVSSTVGHTISAVTGNLTGQQEGFGVRADTTAQSSGGPLVALSPYDNSGEVVGTVPATPEELFSSSGAEIIDGRGSILVKAKISDITPSGSDYTETITLVAAGIF